MLEGLIHSNLNAISKIVTQAAVARSSWLVIAQPKYTLFSVSSLTLQGYQLEKAVFWLCNESSRSQELKTQT